MIEENEEDIEIVETAPPVRLNDIVHHSTLGRFAVIASSDKKVVCQSEHGKIYSLAMEHLTLAGLIEKLRPKAETLRIWKHNAS